MKYPWGWDHFVEVIPYWRIKHWVSMLDESLEDDEQPINYMEVVLLRIATRILGGGGKK